MSSEARTERFYWSQGKNEWREHGTVEVIVGEAPDVWVGIDSSWLDTEGVCSAGSYIVDEDLPRLLRLLLSRLTEAQRWELFRELAGELLPRVHCSRADGGWCWMDGNWTSYVTAYGGETHATVHPNALHRPEELRLLAACCLAAADELERREVQS